MQQEDRIVDPDKLRLARLKRRLRQRDIASQVDDAPQRISDFEQGVRHPSPAQVESLVQLLGDGIFADDSTTGTPLAAPGKARSSKNREVRR
jgi:transcriptional regulator with XRE-family HTH domain